MSSIFFRTTKKEKKVYKVICSYKAFTSELFMGYSANVIKGGRLPYVKKLMAEFTQYIGLKYAWLVCVSVIEFF